MNTVFGIAGILAEKILAPVTCRIRGHKKPLLPLNLNGQLHVICGGCGDYWRVEEQNKRKD